jgi:hypothetical protein
LRLLQRVRPDVRSGAVRRTRGTPRKARGATCVGGLPDGRRAHDAPARSRPRGRNEEAGFQAASANHERNAARAPAISTWTSSGTCTGALRRGGGSPRTSSRTPTRTFESSSTRRKPAARSVPSAAPAPPPRRTSGASSGACLTPPVRRPHPQSADKAALHHLTSSRKIKCPLPHAGPRI